jgi:CRP/FNR family cyclic AMP-dependent transcriptional regulator
MAVLDHVKQTVEFSRNPLFQHLASDELDELLGYAQEQSYENGQTIFSRGDPGDSMLAVLGGRVRISICSEEGKEITLAVIEAGQIFGEMALLDGEGRSADATAIGCCRLLIIRRRDFVPFLEGHAKLAIRLLQILCQRVRHANDFCETIAFFNLPIRLARLLVQLDRTHGERLGTYRRIGLKLSQEELGHLIATSRESVNKQLHAWQSDGLIELAHGYIVIRDINTLRAIGA